MSGFIASTGLDLDLIFQSKIDTINVPSTGFEVKGVNQSIVDLATRYRPKVRNTYTSETGFKTIGNKDLTTLFEWGGYEPSSSLVKVSQTGLTATIEVTGNYYTIDISGSSYISLSSNDIIVTKSDRVTTNPFRLSHSANVFGSVVTFRVRMYNGFSTGDSAKYTDILQNVTTNNIPLIESVDLKVAAKDKVFVNFTGQNYDKIYWSTGIFTGTILISTQGPYEIPTNDDNALITTVKFTPINQYGEKGVIVTKIMTNTSIIVENSVAATTESGTTPAYLYSASFLVIGGGGSGGFSFNVVQYNGKDVTRNVTYTCGAGGILASGSGSRNPGKPGNMGYDSSITVDLLTYTATGGKGGDGGSSGGQNGLCGLGGTPDGVPTSRTNTQTGGILPLSSLGYGSDGGGGAGAGSSGDTQSGGNGFTKATFNYVVMT
jgi:hypothetical protein